jgi:hypothetical protein
MRALLLCALLAPWFFHQTRIAAVGPPVAEGGLSDELVIHESEIAVDLPSAATPLDLTGLRVFEDGEPREVVKIEGALGSAPPHWQLLIYIDRVLSDAERETPALIALAKTSESLARFGSVEVVVADPDPRVAVAATREPMLLKEDLASLAGEARRDLKRLRIRSVAEQQRQYDRLVTFLAERDSPGALQALVLLADPPGAVTAADWEVLMPNADQRPSGPLPDAQNARSVLDAAKLLAAYRWITLPIADHSSSSSLFQPQAAPARAIARETGGAAFTDVTQIGSLVTSLTRRAKVWYQSPSKQDGKIRRVEVKMSGQVLRGSRWTRSGTPVELTEARLRLALEGLGQSPPLKLETAVAWKSGEPQLTLRVLPATESSMTPRPFRFSLAYADQGGTTPIFIHGVLGPTDNPAGTWTAGLPKAALGGPVAVELDDVSRGTWGLQVIEGNAPPGN